MVSRVDGEYWNHRTAYHPRLLDVASLHHMDMGRSLVKARDM